MSKQDYLPQDELAVIHKLEQLGEQPERDPQLAAQTRQNYVRAAHQLALRAKQPQSAMGFFPALGLKWAEFKSQFTSAFEKKEFQPVLRPVFSILIALAMVFGGAGASVYAAQDSQPDELLYPVKTMAEDVRLSLTSDPIERIDLAMAFADTRIAEALQMAQESKAPNADLVLRYEQLVTTALESLTQLEDETLEIEMLKVYVKIQDHDRLMTNQPDPVPGFQALSTYTYMYKHELQGAVEAPYEYIYKWQHGRQVEDPIADPALEEPAEALEAVEEPATSGENPAYGPGPDEPPGSDTDADTETEESLPGYSEDAPFGEQAPEGGWNTDSGSALYNYFRWLYNNTSPSKKSGGQ